MAQDSGSKKYVRYEQGGTTAYGILDGDTIQEIQGDLFGERTPTGKTAKLSEVKLRYPVEPSKILCVGLRAHV